MVVTGNLVKGVSVPFVKCIIRNVYLITTRLISKEIVILTTKITIPNIDVARRWDLLSRQRRSNNGGDKQNAQENSRGRKIGISH